MKTDQSTPGTNKDRSYRSLQQTLKFISKAGETVTTEYSDAEASDKDESAKDHWEKSHKLATLTAQRSGGWVQKLALLVSAAGCGLAGYASVVSTIQAKTSYDALQSTRQSVQTAQDALKIGQRPYVATILPTSFQLNPLFGADIQEVFRNGGNTVARLHSLCMRISPLKSLKDENSDGGCIPGEGIIDLNNSDLFKDLNRTFHVIPKIKYFKSSIIQVFTSVEYSDQKNNTYVKHECIIYTLNNNNLYSQFRNCFSWNDTVEGTIFPKSNK